MSKLIPDITKRAIKEIAKQFQIAVKGIGAFHFEMARGFQENIYSFIHSDMLAHPITPDALTDFGRTVTEMGLGNQAKPVTLGHEGVGKVFVFFLKMTLDYVSCIAEGS